MIQKLQKEVDQSKRRRDENDTIILDREKNESKKLKLFEEKVETTVIPMNADREGILFVHFFFSHQPLEDPFIRPIIINNGEKKKKSSNQKKSILTEEEISELEPIVLLKLKEVGKKLTPGELTKEIKKTHPKYSNLNSYNLGKKVLAPMVDQEPRVIERIGKKHYAAVNNYTCI